MGKTAGRGRPGRAPPEGPPRGPGPGAPGVKVTVFPSYFRGAKWTEKASPRVSPGLRKRCRKSYFKHFLDIFAGVFSTTVLYKVFGIFLEAICFNFLWFLMELSGSPQRVPTPCKCCK